MVGLFPPCYTSNTPRTGFVHTAHYHTRKRFTIDEYHRLIELEFLKESDSLRDGKAERIELIRKELIKIKYRRPTRFRIAFIQRGKGYNYPL